jgi:alpha-tubulin suppressor-like RCC1 family protein
MFKHRFGAIFAVLPVLASVFVLGSPAKADIGELRGDHPRATDAGKLSAGGSHTCAILTDGTLWCWGRNDRGQLGLGDTTDRSSPNRVGSAANWRSVDASDNGFTCAVNTSNQLFCWGFNASGQTGVSSATGSVTSPTQVTALGTTVETVSAGSNSTCAVTTSGSIRCWGSNSNGQLGTAVTLGQSTHTPTAINNLSGTFTSVATSDFGSCALKSDKSVHCWGSDLWGQRGDDAATTADNAAPTRISSTTTATALISGPNSNCLIADSSSGVLCWGRNDDNFLRATSGNITTAQLATAAPFYVNSSNVAARGFSIGSNFACMLKNSDASIICGGSNSMTGIGTTGQVSGAPTGAGFLVMTTGTTHGCAIRSDRRLVCWGHNAYGKLGLGTISTTETASVVSFGAHATQTVGMDPVAPSAPVSVTATANYRSIDASWTPPTSVGTAFINDYQYRLSTNAGSSWGNWTSLATTTSPKRISDLTPGTSYLLQIRAVSIDGTSPETTAPSAVTPTSGCNPLRDCVLGAVGPNGGTIVVDTGPGTSSSRFIEAAPVTWFGGSSDPFSDWQTAITRAANWKWGSQLPSREELIQITNAYNANTSLLAGWGISDPDNYWTSTDPWEDPIDDGNGGYTYPTDEAYAGNVLRDKTWWFQVRPIIYLNGPTALSAPTVTVTASELALSVTWSTPSGGTGGSPTDIETRLSDNGGTSWGNWISRGLVNTLEIASLTAGKSYRVQVRGVNFAGPGASGQSAIVVMTSALSPSTQTISGAVNTAISDSTAFSVSNFNGTVTYSVTSGTLPSGLALNTSTGVISGTPTVESSATITIRGTGATAGTANATVTFAITLPAPDSLMGVWAVDGLNEVVLDWFAPSTGVTPTGYQYAFSTNGGQSFSAFTAFSSTINSQAGSSLRRFTGTVTTGLARGQETIFQVRAMNGTTPGPAFPDPTNSGVWSAWSPRATAKISDPCDPMNDCDVGDVGPGGGIIVYDHGLNAAWGRYIESAPALWNGATGDPVAVFGCSGSTVTQAATVEARAIGTGRVNTMAIMSACTQTGIAARVADAYSVTVAGLTVDDWHLPSAEELNKAYAYRQLLGGWRYSVVTSDEQMYASSSDSNGTYFYGQGGSKMKDFGAYVRPVRYVVGPDVPSAPSVIASVGNGRIDLAWAAPTYNGGNAVSEYKYRLSSDGGVTWTTWTSTGLTPSVSATSLTNGATHHIEVRAVNRGGEGAVTTITALVPGVQTVPVTAGTSTVSLSPFATMGSLSGATFTLSSGALPTGLSLNTSTGEITGTPTVSGTFSVDVTAAVNGTSVSVSLSFTVAAAPTPAPSSPSSPSSTPSSNDQASLSSNDTTATVAVTTNLAMTAEPGTAVIRLNGSLVNATVVQASERLRTTAPGERTVSDVNELRRLADSMLNIVRGALGVGAAMPVSAVDTPTGAVLVGLVVDPVTGRSVRVPIEHVVLVHGGGIVLMVSGDDGREPATIGADGVLEISRGGSVSVLAYGLQAGANGEVVVMSTPRRINSFTVDANGGVSSHARFPSSLPFGSHTVVVTVGDDAASLGFRIVKDYSGLPVTGFSTIYLLMLALVFLAFGFLVMEALKQIQLVNVAQFAQSHRLLSDVNTDPDTFPARSAMWDSTDRANVYYRPVLPHRHHAPPRATTRGPCT